MAVERRERERREFDPELGDCVLVRVEREGEPAVDAAAVEFRVAMKDSLVIARQHDEVQQLKPLLDMCQPIPEQMIVIMCRAVPLRVLPRPLFKHRWKAGLLRHEHVERIKRVLRRHL